MVHGMRELCALLVRGEKTTAKCIEALTSIAMRGYYKPDRIDALARQVLASISRRKLLVKTRLSVCGSTRTTTVYVAVDPAKPASSPIMILAQLLPMLSQRSILCYDKSSAETLPGSIEPSSDSAEILCRIYGVKGDKMLSTCVTVVKELAASGIVTVARGENRKQRLLYILRRKGMVMRISAPLCANPMKSRNVYTIDNKRFTPVKTQLMMLLHAPPSCINA